ncbi:RNase H domain-containing protein [Trichonephila clavipes]|nr:RNase H domain-containing protein [Trichonephila clavipes]
MTASIVQLLNILSAKVKIFLRWVPLNVNICGNQNADGLTRENGHKDSTHSGCLTFSEIATQVKQDIGFSCRQVPVHKWYEGNIPDAALLGTGSRREEPTLLLGFVVDMLELNGMWRILQFTLLVRIAM